VIALVVFAATDIWWFIRLLYTKTFGLFRKKLKVDEETSITSICWSTDLDFFGHMNNSKYLRELDFARCDYYQRTGLASHLAKIPGSYVVLHASTIRYRKSINFLMPFKVTTKLLYFDDRSLYYEHQFVSILDNFVRAVAIAKNTTRKVNLPKELEKLGVSEPMPCPPEVQKFIECHEISSNNMKKD